MTVNKKSVIQYEVKDYSRYIFCSNNKTPLMIGLGNRRIFVMIQVQLIEVIPIILKIWLQNLTMVMLNGHSIPIWKITQPIPHLLNSKLIYLIRKHTRKFGWWIHHYILSGFWMITEWNSQVWQHYIINLWNGLLRIGNVRLIQ